MNNRDETEATTVPETTNRCLGSEEVGYWKSQVLSLQFENEMLCEYINELHTQLINNKKKIEYEESLDVVAGEDEDVAEEEVEEDGEFNKEGRQFRMEREEKRKKEKEQDDDPTGKPPEKTVVKKKDEEMKMLYGTGWRKIMGMETVVQLNFDITRDKEKINYWPILPLKL